MTNILYLSIGSVLSILFAVMLIRGGKYAYLVETLEGNDYPFKSIYCVGFAWNAVSLFSLKGKKRQTLIGYAKLLYDPKYAEYYATVVWAQALSFLHICLIIGFLLAGLTGSFLMLLIGAGMGAFCFHYFINHMRDKLKTREIECTGELPEIVSTMALLINAGMMLRKAWRTIADSKEGTAYELMRWSCSDMDNGMSEVDAIYKFGRLSNSAEIRKFTSALAQSIERGGGELGVFLGRQSSEMWALKKQLMLQKGEAAASKLLAPTAMLFVAIIIAVLTGALGMLI